MHLSPTKVHNIVASIVRRLHDDGSSTAGHRLYEPVLSYALKRLTQLPHCLGTRVGALPYASHSVTAEDHIRPFKARVSGAVADARRGFAPLACLIRRVADESQGAQLVMFKELVRYGAAAAFFGTSNVTVPLSRG
jgi:hypothetical protein